MGLFLWIPTIRGDATEKDHQGEIELVAFQISDGQNRTGGGSLNAREMQVSKKTDSSSGLLFKAAVSEEKFGEMILDSVNEAGTGRFTMTLVQLAFFQTNPDGTETFGLYFEKITFERK